MYTTYAKMKKDFPTFEKDGKKHVVKMDSIIDALRTDSGLALDYGLSPGELAEKIRAAILDALTKHYCIGTDLHAIKIDSGLRVYYADIETRTTVIYGAKTGKQLYRVLDVVGLRLSSYVPYLSKYADYTGIFGKWYTGYIPVGEVAI